MPTRRTTASWLGLDRVLGAVGGRAASVAALVGASAIPAHADDVLNIHDAQLVTYQAAPTFVQDLAPRASQRGVHLDGSMRAGGLMGGIIPGHSGSDLGFNSSRMLNGYVDLFTGAVQVTAVDLALPADPGGNWVIGRTYNNRQDDSGHHISQGPQGNNWAMANPEIELFEGATDDLDVLYVVGGADRYAAFKRIGVSDDEFQGINGATGVVQYEAGSTGEPDTYTLTQPDGTQLVFFGFDVDADVAAGQLWKKVGPGGATAFVGHKTTGSTAITDGFDTGGMSPTNLLTVAYDSASNGGRRYTYSYTAGILKQVVVEICSSGDWSSPGTVTEVGKVQYSHHDGLDSYGSDKDLETVTVTLPTNESGKDLVKKTYYRYWTGPFDPTDPVSPHPGHASALQYVVEAEGYRQADIAGDPLTMDASTLDPHASVYFEYDSSRRVNSVLFNGRCGCAGGSSGEHTISYGTTGTEAAPYDAGWKRRAIIDQPDDLFVTVHFDEVGQVLSEVKTDGDPSGTPTGTWATMAVRGADALIDEISTPANITGYTHSTASFTRSTSGGLVRVVGREGSGAIIGFINEMAFKAGTSPTPYVESQVDYETRSLSIGSATLVVPFVDAQRSVFASEKTASDLSGAGGSDFYDETTVGRTWWSATSTDIGYIRPKAVTTTLPLVDEDENGEEVAHTRVAYVRENGHTAFMKAEDGIYDYMEYQDGLLVESIRDAKLDETGVFDVDPYDDFTISETSVGWHVRTTYAYDDQGRVTQVTAPDGDISQIHRAAMGDGRLVTISIPLVDTSGTTTYHGPVSISSTDLAGNTTESMVAYSATAATTTDGPASWLDEAEATLIEALNIWLANAKNYQLHGFDEAGALLLQSECVFDYVVATDSITADQTGYEYDIMGRRVRMEDATGTINRYSYDVLGRSTMMEVGTDDSGSGDMVVLSETEYDDGNDGGNSYVTKSIARVEDDASNHRVTEFEHDVRGRVIFTKSPLAPHTVAQYDNLGRTVGVAQYSASTGLSASSVPTGTSNRVSYSTMDYDSRGRVWKSVAHEINQSTGTSSDTLESLRWFDSVGRTIKVQGGQLAKTFYDRLGRPTNQFILGVTNDTLYAHADDVDGDHVMEQVITVYESADSSLVDASAVIQRSHDDSTTTGELDTNADNLPRKFTAADIKGRIQITAMWYDELDRLITQANYGTYGDATFDRDHGDFSTPADQTDTDAIVTDTVFLNSGNVYLSIDPEEIKTQFQYDMLGRITRVVRNYDPDDDDTTNEPDGVPLEPTLTNGVDMATWYEYLDGNMTLMTVDANANGSADAKGTDQVTRYIYGVDGGGLDNDASEVASGRLLLAVVYPDSGNSATNPAGIDTSDADVVSFRYNTQGQVVWRKDQAGNVVTTAYDALGRPTLADAAVVSPFDATVDKIAYAYSNRGFLETVTQKNSSGGVLDEVKWSHDGWGNITNIAQDHDSAISSNAHDVAFAYSKSAPSNGRATIRRTSMTFPTGYQAKYQTTNAAIPTALARTEQIQLGSGNSFVTVATYDYLGMASVVGTTLPEPDVYSNRFNNSGTYTQLDDWNRFSAWTWTKDLNTTDIDFYDVSIDFNDRGDITSTTDHVLQSTGTTTGEFDQLYSLDDLGRLIGMERGDLDAGSITTPEETRDWTLSSTGNWRTRQVDLDGDGTYTDPGELDELNPLSTQPNPHFSLANQWEARDIDNDGADDYDLDYDDNGNLTDDDENYTYKYDAWNRLVSISTTDTTPVLVAEYRYNGLGQRISEGDGTNGELLIYDDSWQLISRYDDTASKYTEEILYHHAGLDGHGGSSSMDSVLLRRTYLTTGSPQTEDKRWYILQNWRNDPVVTLTDAGVQVERVHFSPYGEPFGIPSGDVDFDGVASFGEELLISGWESIPLTYKAYADIDLDGDIDSDDATAASGETMGRGVLSHVGSKVGYAGYTQDAYVPTVSHVRYRVYKSDLGRWLQRDPAGYVDGLSLYEYAMSAPVRYTDTFGLSVSGGVATGSGGPEAHGCGGEQPAYPGLAPQFFPFTPFDFLNWCYAVGICTLPDAEEDKCSAEVEQRICNILDAIEKNCDEFEIPMSTFGALFSAGYDAGTRVLEVGGEHAMAAAPRLHQQASNTYAMGRYAAQMGGRFDQRAEFLQKAIRAKKAAEFAERVGNLKVAAKLFTYADAFFDAAEVYHGITEGQAGRVVSGASGLALTGIVLRAGATGSRLGPWGAGAGLVAGGVIVGYHLIVVAPIEAKEAKGRYSACRNAIEALGRQLGKHPECDPDKMDCN